MKRRRDPLEISRLRSRHERLIVLALLARKAMEDAEAALKATKDEVQAYLSSSAINDASLPLIFCNQ